MTGVLVGATMLIMMVMLIRRISPGRISMRFRYALWLLVALRLALPFWVGSSSLSVMNVVKAAQVYLENDVENRRIQTRGDGLDTAELGVGRMETTDLSGQDAGMAGQNAGRETGMGMSGEYDGGSKTHDMPAAYGKYSDNEDSFLSMRVIAIGVWIAGMALISIGMFTGQFRFLLCLLRSRKEIPSEALPADWAQLLGRKGVRVYLVERLPNPCMVGRSIYIKPQSSEDEESLSHILAHEYSHVIQGDALWALVRSMFCIVYWFHPLVWMAAYESKQDSELACDERAVRLLGESQRFSYGRTLLQLTCDEQKRIGCTGIVLTMDGSGRRMKQRVTMIALKKKKSSAAVALAALMAVFACGCTFTGSTPEIERGTVQITTDQEESDIAAEPKENRQKQQNGREETLVSENEAKSDVDETIEAAKGRLEQLESQWQGMADGTFENMLYSMDDTGLSMEKTIDAQTYYEYLMFDKGKCPLKDGDWYMLHRNEQWDINFYGLYTDDYGCRGMKIQVGKDINTYDVTWMSAVMQSGIEVLSVEAAQDGGPRSFIFKMCTRNTRVSEVWELYAADRYDTGTMDLYRFEEEQWKEQFQDMVSFRIDQEKDQIEVICGQEVTDVIDLHQYAGDETENVESVVWDGTTASYQADNNGEIVFYTSIGLKLSGKEDPLYHHIPLIRCPVTISEWGERDFILGKPSVNAKYVNARQDQES